MKPRTITIQPVLNGFIVKVDCQAVVFDSRGALLEALAAYYKDPVATEKEYIRNAVNATLEGPQCGVGPELIDSGTRKLSSVLDPVAAGPYPVGAGEVRQRPPSENPYPEGRQ